MDELISKPLPNNSEAERSVLGAAILDAHAFLRVVPVLRAEDFFLSQHRAIYRAMESLTGTDQPINTVSLMECLTRSGDLDAAGGVPYLSQLADGLPRATDVEHYAKIIRAKARQRKLIYFGGRLQEQAQEGAIDDDVIIENGVAELLSIAGNGGTPAKSRSWREVAKSAVDDLVSAKLNPDRAGRMKFGIKELDTVLGGLKRKEVCILVAPTSNGKSQLASQLAVQSSRDGFKVLYFSAEMPGEQITLRELSFRAGVKFFYAQRPESLSTDQLTRLANAASEPVSIQIVDQDITPARVWAVSEAAKRTAGLDLIIVYYDQLVIEAGIDPGSDDDNVFRHQRSFMLSAKRLADRLDICVVLLCQLRKVSGKIAEGATPRLDDIWGDSSVRNTPHVILWLVREFFTHKMDMEYERKATLYILKSRNGPTGIVNLEFDPDLVRFLDVPEFEEVHVP
jgi:replicative DNA helicase